MNTEFEIAGGSVIGRDHVTMGRNNQDAFCWSATPEATVAVVADGCGSARHSEVGSGLGARLLSEALRRRAPRLGSGDEPPEVALEEVRREMLDRLRELATAMGGDPRQVLCEYFLFTTLGFVIGPRRVVVFGIGDGVVCVNGDVRRLVAAGNEPPYLAYGLVPSSLPEEALAFVLHDSLPTPAVESILVGTDGAADAADLAKLWANNRFFANPYGVGRRLTQLNRRPGVLPDDTTLVVARRGRR